MASKLEQEMLKGLKKKPKDALEPAPKKSRKKTGKPKELDENEPVETVPLEQFVREMHGTADKPQNGMPSLEWIKEQFQTKSAAVRYLINQGFEVKDIAKHLDMRYQHVRNVSLQTLKRGPNEDWRKPILNQNQTEIRQNSVDIPPEDLDGNGKGSQDNE